MPPRSRAKTFLFVCALAIVGSTGLLLAAEIVVRIKFAIDHKDAGYLVLGILPDRRRQKPREERVQIPKKPAGTERPAGAPAPTAFTVTTMWNDCTQRAVEYRANTAGGRGPEWAETKPAGSVRILAFGESVTWGAGASEDGAWPALLEKALKTKHGLSVEVLNWGQPGGRLKAMTEVIGPVLVKYRPDVILHYAGFNQTWQGAEIPGVLSWLNYKSMLYTYIYEKMYFRAEASAARLLPDTREYEKDFQALLTKARAHGASVVVVEEATAAGPPSPERAACSERRFDKTGLQACLNDLMSRPDSRFSRVQWARMYKTDVLQSVLVDVAGREGVPVIDPRGAMAERDGPHRRFCDEAHLTDEGNAVLADAIAAPLAEYIKTQVAAHSGS
jgi:lysophospholipase L1-like esterase